MFSYLHQDRFLTSFMATLSQVKINELRYNNNEEEKNIIHLTMKQPGILGGQFGN